MNHLFNLSAFAYRLLKLIPERSAHGGKVVRWAIVEQLYFTGIQALPIVIPVSLITGTMLISQFTWVSEEYDLGKIILTLVVREFGPMITAFVVILRSASAVTIEVCYMNILNEIDAIEMSGIDPMRLVSFPRLVGITISILSLFIVFDLIAIFGGYVVVWAGTDLPMGNFLSQVGKAFSIEDMIVGIIKTICFGFTITVVSLYHGFNSKRQMTQIPSAVSRAAIECFIFCIVINIFISTVFYL